MSCLDDKCKSSTGTWSNIRISVLVPLIGPSGTWTAKEFVSFEPHAPGKSLCEGGRLELNAFFDKKGEGSLNGLVDVVIQCSMWGDVTVGPGYPWPPDFVEVGPYTNPLTGAVMFNLNQYQ
jgi:hypothetical protein